MTAFQPYRAGQPREQSNALLAMLQGRTAFGQNPMDTQRAMSGKPDHGLLAAILRYQAGYR